jgi:hypothetical protein
MCYMMLDGLTVGFQALFYKYITWNSQIWYSIIIVEVIITTIAAFLKLYESPVYLLDRKESDKCIMTLQQIAKQNGNILESLEISHSAMEE